MPIQLRLFPLHTVLFPGMTLPLHIFEPRYRLMIHECLDQRQPFGVVLINSGQEAGPPAVPHRVGTFGAITQVERLADGRMNIEMVGQERFRILELNHDRPFLTASVERFPLLSADPVQAADCSRRLGPWVYRYLKVLGDAAKVELDHQAVPARPAALAYLAAIVLQIPLGEKQALLDAATAEGMLDHEYALFRREISLVRVMLDSGQSQHDPDLNPN